jgi:LCP family protein required for cell wall assembly
VELEMRLSPLVTLLVVVFAVILTAFAATGAYIGARQVVIESPIELPAPPQIGAVPPTAVQVLPPATATPQALPTGAAVSTPVPGAQATPVASWPDPKRFTVLLLGVDQRPGEKGPFRTDTIMVLSLDPIRKTGAMLSIPRDVYLKIPDYASPLSPNRINAANYIGDSTEYPGGGPKLAVKTVESLLGIQINRYVLVNFQAFTTIIDAVGPIKVCPPERIYDANYPDSDSYGVITVEFQPGCQELNSTQLLQYVRVRHNAGDDMGRATRQQEAVKAVKDKVLSLGGVSALLGKAGTIWETLKDNLKTDMTFDEITQLASVAQNVTTIQSAVLSIKTEKDGQLLPQTLQNGDNVLMPVYEDIYALVTRLFDSGQGGPSNPQASEENATLFVANGAGIDGLAKTTADGLVAKGFNVVGVGNAEGVGLYGKSEIRVYGSKFKTARYLAQVLDLEDALINPASDGPAGVDIQLIVGTDLAPK